MSSRRKQNKEYIVDAFLEGREHIFISELPHPDAVPKTVRRGAFGAPVLAREGNRLILFDPDDEQNIRSV